MITAFFVILTAASAAFCAATLVTVIAKRFDWDRKWDGDNPYSVLICIAPVVSAIAGGWIAGVQTHNNGWLAGLTCAVLAAPALLSLLAVILLIVRIAPVAWHYTTTSVESVSNGLVSLMTNKPKDPQSEAAALRKRLAELEGPNTPPQS